MMSPIRKSILRSRGITLEYVEHGDPAGVPVLMLHGYTDSWHSYELLLPHLPHALRATAISQRGHGDSSRPEADYDPRDFAADVTAFMDAIGIDRAVIVGHSMGSAIAQRFAALHPHRVIALVLIGAFMNPGDNAAAREFLDTGVSALIDPIDPAFARDFQKSTLHRPVPPAFFETVVRESLKVPAQTWRIVLGQLIAADFTADRERIEAPTLILWGDRDGFGTHAEQLALNAAIRSSRLLTYAETGHSPHWEQPGRVAKEIVEFVDAVVGERVG